MCLLAAGDVPVRRRVSGMEVRQLADTQALQPPSTWIVWPVM